MEYTFVLIMSEITVWSVMLIDWSACDWHIMLGWSLICVPFAALVDALWNM